jgi:hypothetical protein
MKLRLVTPVSDEWLTIPKDAGRIFGTFPPDLIAGATVYAAGAVDPEKANTHEVVAHFSMDWKPKKKGTK